MSSASAPSTVHPIVVDDTDPSIKYTANQWFPHDINQLNTLGNLGSVWNGTTMSTSVDGATLSFDFSGTSISVLGTLQIAQLTTGVDPTWTCTIDEVPIANGTNPSFNFPENNWVLCNTPTLLAGKHTLNLKVSTKGTPFYIDSIQYTPTPDVSIDGSVLEFDEGDPAVTYGPGWSFYTVENTQNITQTNGAQATFNFHGTSLLVTGYVPQELPHNATTAKYTVDGGAATTVTLSGLPPQGTTTIFNVPMFSVDNLSPANHKVVVTYLGDSTKTPLAVKSWFVTNSTTTSKAASPAPPNSASASAPGSSTSPGSSSGSSGGSTVVAAKHSNTGAIAGGVVGGLLVLAILAGLLFFLRRRRRQAREDMPTSQRHDADPFGIATTEVGGGGGGASVRTGVTGAGTYATSQDAHTAPYAASAGPSSHATGDPFDPYAQYAGPHTRTLSGGTGTVSASGTGPSGYAHSPVPPQGSVSAPSTSSAGGSGSGAAAAPRAPLVAIGGASPVGALTPVRRTKAQEAQAQAGRRVIVQRHEDSGVRLGDGSQSAASLLLSDGTEVVDLPPNYSRD